MSAYIQIFVIINYSFLILYLLRKKRKSNTEKFFLCLCFSIMLMCITILLSTTHVLSDYINPNSFIGFTYGPLIWLYVKETFDNKNLSFKQSKVLTHFIPALLVLFTEVLLILNILQNQFIWKIIHLALVMQSLIYSVLIIGLLIKHKSHNSIRIKKFWFHFLGASFFVLSIGFAFEVISVLLDKFDAFKFFNQANQIVLLIFSQGILFLGFISTDLLNLRKKYYSSSIKQPNEDLMDKIDSFVEKNEIYLDAELDLNSFAKQFAEKNNTYFSSY